MWPADPAKTPLDLNSSDIVLAQVGFASDLTAAILYLILIAVLGVIGLFMCVIGGVYRKRLLAASGLVLMAPALFFSVIALKSEIPRMIPRTRSWDFSSDRSVSQLDKEPVHGSYYYRGNIRSTIKLPLNRQWSGRAKRVEFEADGGRVARISWQSRYASRDGIYEEAKRILGELGFEEHRLDAWYGQGRHGRGRPAFSFRAEEGDLRIRVAIRGYPRGGGEETSWLVFVDVSWKDGES